jgi:phosphoheptose isomerase
MQDDIKTFRDYYADQLGSGMSEFLQAHGRRVIELMHDAISRSRSTVYLFGNGGSHAISKCLEYALQNYASTQGVAVRIQTGVDVHHATLLADRDSPGTSFTQVLNTEGADSRDLIVLISCSGDSDNLCEVAEYAKEYSIPTLALVGSGGGKLSKLVPAGRSFGVPLIDQQISEDIIQSLAYFSASPLSDVTGAQWKGQVVSRAEQLRQVIRAIPESFIANIAKEIVNAFLRRHFVWVLGVDHPALSVSAEHVAHNLYWDGVYEVSNPPQRLIFSSPTACDFSGISNDRHTGIIEKYTGICDLHDQGVALLYSRSAENQALNPVLNNLTEFGVPTFLLFGEGQLKQPVAFTSHKTGLIEPQLQALVAQVVGHMLGRVIRLKLIEERGSDRTHDSSDAAHFLVDFDLAQRRRLNA